MPPNACVTTDDASSRDSAVLVNKLSFTYEGTERPILRDFDLDLPPGARCLLIGQNGAGKSTLLRILAGRHLTKPDEAIVVLGKHPFRDTSLNKHRVYMPMDWGMRTVSFAGHGMALQADIPVSSMMKKDQQKYPERRDELLRLLGVDPAWRMHQVSDGQRRRIQLLLGLMKPFRILLLDEITASLDVVVRQDLLKWLRNESETRGATIIYTTHIFDGLDEWPTHVTYLTRCGNTGWQGKLEDLELLKYFKEKGEAHALLKVVYHWLSEEQMLERGESGGEADGPEKESGSEAVRDQNPHLRAHVVGGGYAPGRMAHHDA